MAFRSYDSLRLFDAAARNLSFTLAAEELNMTKGAISYRIGRLESDLGFAVFERGHRSLALTERGERLWRSAQAAFRDLDRTIAELRQDDDPVTIATSTYFASRWLSPRLMTFLTAHPRVALRLQPLVNLVDLGRERFDIAIRWGNGDWSDLQIEPLFPCPAFPTASPAIAGQARKHGLEAVLRDVPLLHDRDGSTAWADWHRAADLPYAPGQAHLVIPDPNVRVQALIDGQGIALNDALLEPEISAGRLERLSPVALDRYGYFLAYRPGTLDRPGAAAFRDWIAAEVRATSSVMTEDQA